MILFGVFSVFYGAVAVMAAIMTLWEQKRRGTSLVLRLAAFALCLIWPVTVVMMLGVMQWRKMAAQKGASDKMDGATVKVH